MSKKQFPWLEVLVIIGVIMLRYYGNDKGRLMVDSIRYFGQAYAFPDITNNIAPIGYPLLVKIFSIVTGSYIFGSKLLAIIAFIVLIAFSWRKKFYQKEILLVASFISVTSIYSMSITEGCYISVSLMFYYYLIELVTKEKKSKVGLLAIILAFAGMYMLRFAALYNFIGLAGLILYFIYKRKKNIYSSLIAVTAGCIGIMLLYNYVISHFVPLENSNFEIATDFSQLFKNAFYGIVSEFNPFIHDFYGGNEITKTLTILGGLFFIFLISYWVKSSKLSSSDKLLIYFAVINITLLFASTFIYSMDKLDYRLLGPYTFFIWIVLIKLLWSRLKPYYYYFMGLNILVSLVFIIYFYVPFQYNYNKVQNYFEDKDLNNIVYQYNPKKINDIDIIVLCMYPEFNNRIYDKSKEYEEVISSDTFKDQLKIKDNFVK